MHSIVVAPGLAKSLSGELDLWDNLRLTYTLITTNSKNRVEQHLTICHQPSHGYHIYLISIDCLNYLYWLLDLTRTYFNTLEWSSITGDHPSGLLWCLWSWRGKRLYWPQQVRHKHHMASPLDIIYHWHLGTGYQSRDTLTNYKLDLAALELHKYTLMT